MGIKKYVILSICIMISVNKINAEDYLSKALDTIVLIEKKKHDELIAHGTGYFFWNYNKTDFPIVVTCGHLIHNQKELYVNIKADSQFIEFAQKNGINQLKSSYMNWEILNHKIRTKINFLSDNTTQNYIQHSNLDIAAFVIHLPKTKITLVKDSTSFFIALPTKISKKFILNRNNLYLGQKVQFIGFPFGLGASFEATNPKIKVDVIEPLVRFGSISWMSANSPLFLLDAFSFGGNSGGPIISEPILNEKGEIATYLVGMVGGHLEQKINALAVNGKQKKIDPIKPVAIDYPS